MTAFRALNKQFNKAVSQLSIMSSTTTFPPQDSNNCKLPDKLSKCEELPIGLARQSRDARPTVKIVFNNGVLGAMPTKSIKGTAMHVATPAFANGADRLARTGVSGLDDVLGGGFSAGRLYLIEGVPGSGKTTLAFQFLMEGAREKEPVLYVSLAESREEIHAMAASHGWDIQGIGIQEVIPSESVLNSDDQYTMFHPSEIELSETTKSILADVERIKPRRIVFDSLSELRLLSGSPLRYRRQILALKQFFAKQNCTVLLLDDLTATDRDLQVQSISHGVVLLEQTNPEYGADRRRLRVVKYRGHAFSGGDHDYFI